MNKKEAYSTSPQLKNQPKGRSYPNQCHHGKCGTCHLNTLGQSKGARGYNPGIARKSIQKIFLPGCFSSIKIGASIMQNENEQLSNNYTFFL